MEKLGDIVKSEKFITVILIMTIIILICSACEGDNIAENDSNSTRDIFGGLSIVNEYKESIGHTKLTEEDAKRMQEYPVYPNGKSCWDRVVDFVESKRNDDGTFQIVVYEEMPDTDVKKLNMVNSYYGELGGGPQASTVYAPRKELDFKFPDGKTLFEKEAEVIFEWFKKDQRDKVTNYSEKPRDINEQIELVQEYYRSLPVAPIIEEDIEKLRSTPGYDEGTTQWDELVQYAYLEMTGQGPKMKGYDEVPTNLDAQLYMVNACRKIFGQPPVLKGELTLNFIDGDYIAAWDDIVKAAFEISNMDYMNESLDNKYFHYEYYWSTYVSDEAMKIDE